MATDKNGKEITVGSIVTVRARIEHIVGVGESAMMAGITETPHGPEAKRYSLPVLHGSQVEVVEE